MKTKENERKEGISLIVLVITIIVIIILAAAVIVTLNNNNPIEEANKARYESDVANMQAIFTNTVAKVMAQKKTTIKVKEGIINKETSGVSSSIGEVEYIENNTVSSSEKSGKIVFDSKENEENVYYTGKKLPVYSAGNTVWSVDEEGTISLEVGERKYGTGEQSSEGSGTTKPINPSEGGAGGVSQEAYNSLVSRMDKIEETINTQNSTIQSQNEVIQGQEDRIYKLENETILNKREVLLDNMVEVPCASIGDNNVNVNINLSKSIEEYKYLEIQTDIYSNIYGNHMENTNIIAVNTLNYWNNSTVNWSNESAFSIESIVTNRDSYLDAIAWFKNETTLYVGRIYTDRSDFKKLRIKKIYGIK